MPRFQLRTHCAKERYRYLVRKLEYSAPTHAGSRRHGRTVRCQPVGRTASIARLNRSQQCAATGPLKMLAQASRRFHHCQQHGVRANPATDSRPTKTMLWNHGTRLSLASPLRLLGITPDSRRSDAISVETSIAPAGTTRERAAAAIVKSLNHGENGCMWTNVHGGALVILPWGVSQGGRRANGSPEREQRTQAHSERYRFRTHSSRTWP